MSPARSVRRCRRSCRRCSRAPAGRRCAARSSPGSARRAWPAGAGSPGPRSRVRATARAGPGPAAAPAARAAGTGRRQSHGTTSSGRHGTSMRRYSVFARPGGAGSTGSPSCDLSFFCTSTSPTSSAGDDADTGTHAALGAAHAVEGLPLAAGGEDAAEGRQRRADQIDAAHQLHRPIVGIDAVDDVGQHVEGVRASCGR